MPRLTLAEPEAQARLAGFIAGTAGVPVRILEARPLQGGAIQENWLVTAEIGGEAAPLVLRTDAPTGLAVSHGRAQEFAILTAAHGAGVSVPEPLWLCRDPAVLGRDFYLMRRIAGVSQGYRVVKDKTLGGDRAKLLVIYCLRDCWMSWNAAKRVLSMGYANVAWYPDGTDGWTDMLLPVTEAQPAPAVGD